jgi:photoactive yellow protein
MRAPDVFEAEDIRRLSLMGDRELDALPFGVIKLDARGTVLAFNVAEGELSGFRPADVVGRNFFHDVAPCTRTKKFFGRFQEGVAAGRLNASFEYRFDLQSRPSVWVHMAQGAPGEYLVVVKRIGYDG